MLNSDRLVEYLRLNCRTDVFWLDTVGRSGLQMLPTGFLEGRQVRRLLVVRSKIVGSTVHSQSVRGAESYSLLSSAETRTIASPALEEMLTNDDFLVVDDRAAVHLLFDDHNRFAFARAGLDSLNRYRFIRDMWWPTAERI